MQDNRLERRSGADGCKEGIGRRDGGQERRKGCGKRVRACAVRL